MKSLAFFLLSLNFLVLLGCASTRVSAIQTGEERYQIASGSTGSTPISAAMGEFQKMAKEVCQGNYRYIEEWNGDSRNADWMGWPSYSNFTIIGTVQCQ